MLTALLVVLGIIGYLHVGFHLGDISLKTWLAKDNDSVRSFLLFPVSHHKKRVGERGDDSLAFIGGLDLEDKTKDSFGGSGYTFLMTFIWPLKLLFNIPAITLYGAIDGVGAAVRAIREANAKALAEKMKGDPALLPSVDDDVYALFAKRQEVASRLQQLVERRKAIDEELERRKAEVDAAFEVEGAVDPEVRQLVAPKKESS